MAKTTLRTEYTRDLNEQESDRTALDCQDPSLAQQHYKDECDINVIADRFGLTGEMPQVLHLPQQGDFTGIYDFTSLMLAHNKAVQGFMELPAKIRARFRNDPQELLDFMKDPDNRDEAVFLGLVQKGDTMPAAQSSATTGDTHETGSDSTTAQAAEAGAGQTGTPQSQGDPGKPEKPGPKASRGNQR